MNAVLRKSKIALAAAVFMAIWLVFSGIVYGQGAIKNENEFVKKEEDIYVSLENNGAFANAYVINSFTLKEPAVIEDYGAYDKVTNLTTTDTLKVEGEKITVNAPMGRFYYQGNISKLELPWSFDIKFRLDGKEVSPEKLSGAAGNMEITISIKPNQKAREDFSGHYAVQTTLTLDSGICTEIEANGATIANAGKNKTISYNLLPGSEALYSISANVKDFHMDGIRFAAVPFSFSLEGIDMSAFEDKFSGLKELSGGIEELDNAAKQLKDGTAELTDGAASLRNGMKSWQAGLTQLNDSFSTLTKQNAGILEGSGEIRNGLLSIAQSLPQQLMQLKAALENLAQNYTEFHNGLAAYMGATEELSRGYRALNDNYSQLVAASGQLYSGASELYNGTQQLAQGTGKLRQGTDNIDAEMEKAVVEFMASFSGGEFEPVSFVSEQNPNVKAVQFIMQTKGIDKKPQEVQQDEPKGATTFWKRLLALFGL